MERIEGSKLYRYLQNIEGENFTLKTIKNEIRALDEGKILVFNLDAADIGAFGFNEPHISTSTLQKCFSVQNRLNFKNIKMTIPPLSILEIYINLFNICLLGSKQSSPEIIKRINDGEPLYPILEECIQKNLPEGKIGFLKKIADDSFWERIKTVYKPYLLEDYINAIGNPAKIKFKLCPFYLNNRKYDSTFVKAFLNVIRSHANPIHIEIDINNLKHTIFADAAFPGKYKHILLSSNMPTISAYGRILCEQNPDIITSVVPARHISTASFLILGLAGFKGNTLELKKFLDESLALSNRIIAKEKKSGLTPQSIRILLEKDRSVMVKIGESLLNSISTYEHGVLKELGIKVAENWNIRVAEKDEVGDRGHIISNSLQYRLKTTESAIKHMRSSTELFRDNKDIMEEGVLKKHVLAEEIARFIYGK